MVGGRRIVSGLTAALVAASLLAPAAQAAESAMAFRPVNLKPAPSSVEAGLWGVSDKAETHVMASAELDRDPALTAYVRSVTCKIAPEYCPELRVYILDRPVFQAQVAPNGYAEVWSGLLLRVRTEDELAYVLGHEVTHFARNHVLERWNARKRQANVTLALTAVVTVGAVGAMYSAAASGAPNAGQTINNISYAAQSLNDLIYLSGIAAYFGFNREEESEADRLGYERAVRAGYRKAAASVWQEELAESQASDFKRVREGETRPSIFDTHPITPDRIASLQAMGSIDATPDPEATKRYRAVIRPHLASWLKDELRRRDYGESLHLIGRLSAEGEDLGVLNFYRGEAYRQRRADGDAAQALAAYQAASAQPDAPAETWRELGAALRKNGDKAAASKALQTYLAKAPQADDRWIVEGDLKTLTEGS